MLTSVQSTQIKNNFATAILEGLSGQPKEIPCRYLYDAVGSELFENITELDEYYLTRTEISLLKRFGKEIVALAGSRAALVEFGSGSSRKTRLLIEAFEGLSAYIPIDISESALKEAKSELHRLYPDLPVFPVHADFHYEMHFPGDIPKTKKLGFFPGSTIGNLTQEEAKDFLMRAAGLLGRGSAFVIGVDLKKDRDILIPAYDDRKGVSAAFNLNLLKRINRELEGNFDMDGYAHKPIYNDAQGRIEIYIESLKEQTVTLLDRSFAFKKGECIHTENSHKYSLLEFQELARAAGWTSRKAWVDEQQLFSLHYLDISKD